MLFVNTLKAPFINHMLGSATKSFLVMVMSGKMIENMIRSEKIDAGEHARKPTPRKKENEVNNSSVYKTNYSKLVMMVQLITLEKDLYNKLLLDLFDSS